MIRLYSGTGGSGKSIHLARDIELALTWKNQNVLANFPINTDLISRKGKRKIRDFVYLMNDELTVPYLKEYAEKHHKAGKESQSLIIIDEGGIMFNPRDAKAFDRKEWINFFMVHRHYGFDVIIAAQHDRLIDRQIRSFFEYDVKHRKVNNFGWIGLVLKLLRIPLFVAVEYWYSVRVKNGHEFFRYRKRDSKLYDTMMLFGGKDHGARIGETPAPAPDVSGDTERSEEGPHEHPDPPQGVPDTQAEPEAAEEKSAS